MKEFAAYYPGVYTYSDTSRYFHPWFPSYNPEIAKAYFDVVNMYEWQGVAGQPATKVAAGLAQSLRRSPVLPVDEVTPGKSFVDDLDIDSLSMVEIAVGAQDKFGVKIPDDQLKDLTTVQDVVNYVARKVEGSA